MKSNVEYLLETIDEEIQSAEKDFDGEYQRGYIDAMKIIYSKTEQQMAGTK